MLCSILIILTSRRYSLAMPLTAGTPPYAEAALFIMLPFIAIIESGAYITARV